MLPVMPPSETHIADEVDVVLDDTERKGHFGLVLVSAISALALAALAAIWLVG